MEKYFQVPLPSPNSSSFSLPIFSLPFSFSSYFISSPSLLLPPLPSLSLSSSRRERARSSGDCSGSHSRSHPDDAGRREGRDSETAAGEGTGVRWHTTQQETSKHLLQGTTSSPYSSLVSTLALTLNTIYMIYRNYMCMYFHSFR